MRNNMDNLLTPSLNYMVLTTIGRHYMQFLYTKKILHLRN